MRFIIKAVQKHTKHFKNHIKLLSASAMAVAACAVTALPVFAETTANSALTTAATNTASQIQADINAVIPIALGLMGAVLGLTIGIRLFRTLAKAGTRG